ncbi:MAG: L,D-transpeptidase family protein [Rhizobiaceae bacterium]
MRLLQALLLFVFVTAADAREIWHSPENPATHLRVFKSKRILEVWRGEERIRAYMISLGRNPHGPKEREGDGRTPEGSYFIDFRKSDSVAYRAFHISYPTREQRAAARAINASPGGSIMIHGQWNGFGWLGWMMQNYDWTNGCIGLSNDDIDDLWNLLAWNTPIEILP